MGCCGDKKPPLTPASSVEDAMESLRAHCTCRGSNWFGWYNIAEAFRRLMRETVLTPPPMPTWEQERGIVITGGGWRFFPGIYVTVRMIRHLGCNLPIQVWYLGDRGEFDPRMKAALDKWGVGWRCAQSLARERGMKRYWHPQYAGWQLKSFAAAYSPFRTTVSLDADCYPVKKLDDFLNHPEFQRVGAAFWPDQWTGANFKVTGQKDGKLEPGQWERFGVPYHDEPAWESGQFVVDKSRHWRPLALADMMNHHCDYVYRHIYGDKDTFHLAWRRCSHEVCVPVPRPRFDQVAFLQGGFDQQTLFIHRTRDKFRWAGESIDGLKVHTGYMTRQYDHVNRFVPQFPYEKLCHGFCKEALAVIKGSKIAAVPVESKTPPRVVIAVISCEKNAERRTRQTWLRSLPAGVEAFHVVGGAAERSLSGGVLSLPCDDTYDGLPTKIRGVCQYFTEAFPQTPWLLKVDDDVSLTPSRLMPFLDAIKGDFVASMTAGPEGVYPHGFTYLLSQKAANEVAARMTEPKGVEDRLIATHLTDAGLEMTHTDDFRIIGHGYDVLAVHQWPTSGGRKTAVLRYSSKNIGDDFQSIAIERLLPSVDLTIDRDDMEKAKEWGDDVSLIVNGWAWQKDHSVWPPPGDARKLYVGCHFVDEATIPKGSRPIGCRDPWSQALCAKAGVESWLSWCATLTLDRPDVPRDDSVLFVDVPAGQRLPVTSTKIISHRIPSHMPQEKRRDLAQSLLDQYARAKLVVTTRLHALLPCAAVGTPVVLLAPPDDARFYPQVAPYAHFAWQPHEVDWKNPTPRVDVGAIRALMAPFRRAVADFLAGG